MIPVPDPLPFDMPPGDPEEVAGLLRDVEGAAARVAAVDDRLLGAAVGAPGWLGDDAAAAAAQVGTVAGLVGAVGESLLTAAGRLSTHRERLEETRRQVSALVAEQQEQFAEAWERWAQIRDLHLQVVTGGPDVRAIVDEVEAGEAGRRRRYAALLEELADDAAATARVLADSCAVVGGRGARGDADRVVVHLAALLPGWGDLELARRGRALAEAFAERRSPDERSAMAREALPFAGSPVFAGALLRAWGPAGMRETLLVLGDGDFGPESPLARLVALVLGASARAGSASAPVMEVLDTEYVPEWDPETRHDLAVLGMGVVLAASLALGSRGLAAPTVASWGRQISARERAMGAGALTRVSPLSLDVPPVDPLPSVVAILADGPDPAAAAAFLNGRSVWDVLLSRQWDDCGTSVNRLIRNAAAVEGPAGDEAVRGGLAALGAGLADDGDPDDWTVNRAAAAAVTPALGDALAAHVPVAGDALVAGADGDTDPATGDLLRGLGYLTLDRTAAAVVEQALHRWVLVQPTGLAEDGPLPRLPAIVVPNAYLAVQEYGQRLAHTLHAFEQQQEAEDRSFLWNVTVSFPLSLVPGPWGVAAGVVEEYLAMGLGYDGTWDNGSDRGLTFRPEEGLASLTPEERRLAAGIAAQARDSFEGTTTVLGRPRPPTSPETHWWGPLVDAVAPAVGDIAEERQRHSGARMRLPR